MIVFEYLTSILFYFNLKYAYCIVRSENIYFTINSEIGMFILLCSPHSFLLIELLTTSLILISFFFSRIVTEKPHQGSVNKLLYCIVLYPRRPEVMVGRDRE